MEPDFQNRIFSVVEAAEYLRVGRSFIHKLIRTGKIRPSRVGRRTLIKGTELEELTKPEK